MRAGVQIITCDVCKTEMRLEGDSKVTLSDTPPGHIRFVSGSYQYDVCNCCAGKIHSEVSKSMCARPSAEADNEIEPRNGYRH